MSSASVQAEQPQWFREALAVKPVSGLLQVEGVPIHYLRWGQRGSPGLVLLHGTGAHAQWWSFLAPQLAREYDVLAVELSGHGESGWRERYDVETWADEVRAVIAAAGFSAPPVVLGHSLGGLVTACLAARFPQVLGGAIVVDSPTEALQDGSWQASHVPRVYPDVDTGVARFRLLPAQPMELEFIRDFIARTSLKPVEGGWTWKFDSRVFECMPFTHHRAYLHGAAQGRLAFLRGEKSWAISFAQGQALYEELGRRTPVIEVPLAHHHLMLDQPLSFLAATRGLLAAWSVGHRRAAPRTAPGPSPRPVVTFPAENRRVLLARRPRGIPSASDFELASAPLPQPGPDELLIRNVFLSVDPAQRGWASAEKNYSAPVALGEVMRALAVGVVVESRDAAFQAGEFLYGWFGWQHYAVVKAAQVVTRVDQPLPASAGASVLGINGLTACLALTQCGRPRPNDVLLVSSAAGSVGSMVGQLGRILGCRTVGLAGGAEKVARCKTRYAFDDAYDYRQGELDAYLSQVAPEGFDVYFDNVGGETLDTALRHMKRGGRVVQCGTASIASWEPPPVGPRAEREVMARRLSWNGFVVFDHAPRFAETLEQLAAWCREGRLVYDEDISHGIEAAPGSLTALYAGDHLGKTLIDVGT